jgi:Heavy-metal resistance
MRRAPLILLVGLIGAVLGYCAVYFTRVAPHRELMQSPAPELAWLKKEYRLSDAEFERVSNLHASYLPRCEEMCRRIGAKNSEIKKLIDADGTNVVVLEQKLAEALQLQLQCHTNMLRHFISVSQQMPPEQGRRYLAWIEESTLLQSGGMMMQHQAAPAPEAASESHHH